MEPVLKAKNITVLYDGRPVVSDVSLSLGRGEMLALLGPNGAGKTTLIRSLNGTVNISKGTVELDGRPLQNYSRREVARKVGVVAQENETKFPVTVREFILAGRFARGTAFGWESSEDMDAADAAMENCDLAHYGPRLMNELSGGERQRVVLARALATEAEIFLLDEPTANMDLANQAMIFEIVAERCRTKGAAAVVITHDLNLASEFADKAILIDNGIVHAAAATGDVLTIENLKGVFGVDVLLDEHPVTGKLRVTQVYSASGLRP